jgi:hypothetical protein
MGWGLDHELLSLLCSLATLHLTCFYSPFPCLCRPFVVMKTTGLFAASALASNMASVLAAGDCPPYDVPVNQVKRAYCVTNADYRVAGQYWEDIEDNGELQGDFLRDCVPRYLKCDDEYITLHRINGEVLDNFEKAWRLTWGNTRFYDATQQANALDLGLPVVTDGEPVTHPLPSSLQRPPRRHHHHQHSPPHFRYSLYICIPPDSSPSSSHPPPPSYPS